MNTIPASQIVSVVPSVIDSGGSALVMQGLFLTSNDQLPAGNVFSFPSATAIKDYFGSTSDEAIAADAYFLGFDNSTKKPGSVLMARYNKVDVAGYTRGGDISGISLTALKAITAGTLTATIKGVRETSGTITLSGATSPSDAANIIETAFTLPDFSVSYDSISGGFVFLNDDTGADSTVDFIHSVEATATACTSLSTVLTVAGTVTGTFRVGSVVSGTDSTNSLPASCTILNQITGEPGLAGTYTISAAAAPSNLGSAAVKSTGPLGGLSVSLHLTETTGAVLSQGADASTPGSSMDWVTSKTTNFALFATIFNPDATGNADKLLFSDWANSSSDRYAYIAWDHDITPTESTNATTSLGQLIKENANSGTSLMSTPTFEKAAMICGMAASIDFEETNGRINFAFRSQSGQSADVTDQTASTNLLANGYNFYGTYATGNDTFTWLYNGSISGKWKWLNSYIYQIWINNAFQLALMTMLGVMKSIPYNASGYAVIRAWMMDPIRAAMNFGAIRAGVSLSSGQAVAVNTSAGVAIDGVLSTQGWYLQILDATAQVRGNRGTPPMKFWYMDGGDVNMINLSSIEVQ